MSIKDYIRSELDKGQCISFFMFHENEEYKNAINQIISEAIAKSEQEEARTADIETGRQLHLNNSRQKRIERALAQQNQNATK